MPNQILTHTQDSKLLPNVRLFDVPANATPEDQAGVFQDIVDYLHGGNLPIVNYCNSIYNLYKADTGNNRYCFLPTSQMLQSRNYNNKAQPYYCGLRIYYDNSGCFTCYNMWKENATFCYLDAGTTSYNTGFTPTEDLHPATKKYVDDCTSPKLNKVTDTNTYGRVYGISTAGEQVTVCISPGLVNNTLVRRSGNQIIVPNTPTAYCHATSKCYVDSAVLCAVNSDTTCTNSCVKKVWVGPEDCFNSIANKNCCQLYFLYE